MQSWIYYVLHVEMVDVRHSQLKSAVMEKDGCERSLDFLMKKLSIDEIVTDASSRIIKMLGEYFCYLILYNTTFILSRFLDFNFGIYLGIPFVMTGIDAQNGIELIFKY
jgi:hypothetical protein